jgi:hypothetical protein
MTSALDGGVGGQGHAPPAFTPGKDLVPILQGPGWVPGPVWIGAEYLAPTGIRSPDLPALSESLYLLRYPVPPMVKEGPLLFRVTVYEGLFPN